MVYQRSFYVIVALCLIFALLTFYSIPVNVAIFRDSESNILQFKITKSTNHNQPAAQLNENSNNIDLSILEELKYDYPRLPQDLSLGPPIPSPWEYIQARNPYPNCYDMQWTPLSDSDYHPKLFDFILFSFDMDMLEVRLNELDPVVDYFIILESRKTFTFRDKPLLYDLNKNTRRFKKFKSKVIHIILDTLEGESSWDREHFTRQELFRLGFSHSNITDGDLYILSDVDEIPRGSLLRKLKSCKGYSTPVCLRVPFFYYSYETRVR